MEISGFADSNEKNQKKLSQDRANKIKSELVKRGITSTRLLAVGYGSTMPLVPSKDILAEKDLNKREALRQINRRVSFKIIKLADK
jgi:outer membrane protein OmpA-like peptidoglycan-associated protein